MRKIGIDLAEVDATKIVEDSNEFLVVPAIIAREGVFPYPEGKAFKPAEELKAATWTVKGRWLVTEKHPDTMLVLNRDLIKGEVENAQFCSEINGIRANLRFFKEKCDSKFLDEIKTGKRKDVSLGFTYDFDATPGIWKGMHYDFVQRNILADHVAAGVPLGRCSSPYCGIAVDSLIRKAALDPEETENFIHLPVDDAGDFVENSFRTIDIDVDKGIKAVVGKLKTDPDGSTHIQKYLFDKGKDWTMEKAQAWVNEHKKSGDAANGLTAEEIKEKIQELVAQRDRIMDKLYPKTTLTQKEQEKARTDLTIIDAQMKGIEEFVAQKFVGGAAGDAVWDTAYINNLPDSAFAYIEDGGEKDDQGKTVPRSLRHLPYKNAEGEIDHDHLVNALARVKQSATMPEGGKTSAIQKLCSAVRSWNKAHPDSKIESEVCGTEASADAFCEIERARRFLESQ